MNDNGDASGLRRYVRILVMASVVPIHDGFSRASVQVFVLICAAVVAAVTIAQLSGPGERARLLRGRLWQLASFWISASLLRWSVAWLGPVLASVWHLRV